MIKDLLHDYNPKHTDYQITNFILGISGKTQWGQYRQALREMFPRLKNIINLMAEIEIDEIESTIEIPSEKSKKEKRIKEIKKQQKILNLEHKKKNLAATIVEFKKFYTIAIELRAILGGDKMDSAALESEYWIVKFKEKLAIEIMSNGRPGIGTLEAIVGMPEKNILMSFISTTNMGEYLSNLAYAKHEPQNLISDEDALTLIEEASNNVIGLWSITE